MASKFFSLGSLALTGALVLCNNANAAQEDLMSFAKCPDVTDSLKRLSCFDAAAQKVFSKKGNVNLKASLAEAEAQRAEEQKKQADSERAVAAGKETLSSVRKLQVRLQTGVSYREYPAVLSDAKFAVTEFSQSAHAERFPEFTALLKAAISDYEIAKFAWDYKFSPCDRRKCLVVPINDPVHNKLLADYPGLSAAKIDQNGYVGLYVDDVMPIIWNAAGKRIDQAAKFLEK